MQSRIAKTDALALPAAEAARAVGLRSVKDFRAEYVVPGYIKPMRTKSETYAVEDLKRAVRSLSSAPAEAQDQAFLTAEALRRVS
jgi:hypothetical protein